MTVDTLSRGWILLLCIYLPSLGLMNIDRLHLSRRSRFSSFSSVLGYFSRDGLFRLDYLFDVDFTVMMRWSSKEGVLAPE